MQDIYTLLQDLAIPYEKHDHPPVFTVEESKQYERGLEDAGHSKNLFLRNKKGDKYYLLVLEASKRANIKAVEEKVGEKNLSFASPDKLMHYLGLTPGSVSPLGLIHDKEHLVHVLMDEDLMKYKKQGYHPNINTSTIIIKTPDFKRFLEWTGNPITYLTV